MRLHRVIFSIIFFTPIFSFAQYLSKNGNFQVSEIKGCAPLTITFTNLKAGACTAGSPCDVKFQVTNTITDCVNAFVNSSAATTQNPVTVPPFTQPGTYRIIVLYQGDCDEITITVTPNIKPAFNVFTCGNNEFRVQVTDNNYNSYRINYNDGSPIIPAKDHQYQYASSGTKSISVRGLNTSAANNCFDSTKTVLAIASLSAPFINQLTVNDNATDINLSFPGASSNVLYRVDIGVNSTTFQFLKNINDVTSTVINPLTTNDRYYCFRLGAVDQCNNQTFYSNTICSTNFDVAAQNNQNNLSWTTSTTGITNFSIDRDGSTLQASQPSSPYIDAAVTCNVTYQYQITTNYSNGSTSISSHQSATAISTTTPTSINNVTAVVNTNGVDLTWQQDPIFTPAEYSVFKKATSSFILDQKVTTQQASDPQYNSENQFCYKVNYVDACNNASADGIETCPIILTSTVSNDNTITLTWTAYNGWVNGVDHYIVEKYNSQGQLISSINTNSTTYSEPNDPSDQIYVFIIKAEANDAGLGQAVSNDETVIKEPNIYYPRAFTPDGKGPTSNEIFNVYGQYVVGFEMKIYNRWGELMFATNDIAEGWDGTVKGKQQPEGTYAFIAHITDNIGRTYTRSGSVVLLRKQ